MAFALTAVYKESLAQGREINTPRNGPAIAFVTAAVLFYVAAAYVHTPGTFHFANERGGITVLSAVLLGMAAGIAWATFFLIHSFLRESYFSKTVLFWLAAASGLSFFAWDELYQLHEKVGSRMGKTSLGASAVFRNWNDLVVILYGVVAIAALAYFLPEILRYPRLPATLAAAFAFYTIHTVADSLHFGVILEETAKLLTSTYLAISMFVGLVAVGALIRESTAEE